MPARDGNAKRRPLGIAHWSCAGGRVFGRKVARAVSEAVGGEGKRAGAVSGTATEAELPTENRPMREALPCSQFTALKALLMRFDAARHERKRCEALVMCRFCPPLTKIDAPRWPISYFLKLVKGNIAGRVATKVLNHIQKSPSHVSSSRSLPLLRRPECWVLPEACLRPDSS